jgi:hypothetical protein
MPPVTELTSQRAHAERAARTRQAGQEDVAELCTVVQGCRLVSWLVDRHEVMVLTLSLLPRPRRGRDRVMRLDIVDGRMLGHR